MKEKTDPIGRRDFVKTAAAGAAAVTIVPAHVLGGPRHVAPSDKLNVAYIGLGTQGIREMKELIEQPDVQVTALCDAQRKAIDYYDWGPTMLRDRIREMTGNSNWNTGGNNTIAGGLDNGVDMVDGYYSRIKQKRYKGVKAYTDFRELFEKEKIDAVKVMTTDHVHGVMAMAALKRGIPVTMHKPISNRLIEAKKVIDMAHRTDVTTHLIPWENNGDMTPVMKWIEDGAIGNLKEVHNWSYRPVWPQYAEMPTDKPKLPDGFDWDLWLGPEAMRPYHPHYTNMVYRGWYDFGGGSMADMGHYSLWCVYKALELEAPTLIEPNYSSAYNIANNTTANKIRNDYSFPLASSVRFRYPGTEKRGPVDLFWYDGGMRPQTPAEFYEKDIEFPAEGMMFVGDEGIIMTPQFLLRDPYILKGDVKKAKDVPPDAGAVKLRGVRRFLDGIKEGRQIDGSFRNAWPITEAVNLYAASLRAGTTLKYDASEMKITNNTEANAYLDREYRPGWELDKI